MPSHEEWKINGLLVVIKRVEIRRSGNGIWTKYTTYEETNI